MAGRRTGSLSLECLPDGSERGLSPNDPSGSVEEPEREAVTESIAYRIKTG